MEIRVLGALEVVDDDGGPVPLGGDRERLVLAALTTAAERTVSVDRLAFELWGDAQPANPAKVVQNVVLRLRRALERLQGTLAVETRPGGYALRAPGDAIDARRFETLVAKARIAERTGEHAARGTLLAEALSLWRGEVLAGIEDRDFAIAERARLDELFGQATEEYIDALLQLDRVGEALLALEERCAAEPYRESLWRQRMVALYRAGRQADALAVARQARRVLAEEVGLDPSPAFAELEHAIANHDPALIPPRRSLPAGLVTFMFTDVERSTELLHRLGAGWVGLAGSIGGAIREAVDRHGGVVVKPEGDGFFAAFDRADAAVAAAVEIQQSLAAAGEGGVARVGIGLHSGDAEPIDDDYIALPAHQAARICAAAHGGQILVSDRTASLAAAEMAEGVTFRPLGSFQLRGFPAPDVLHQVVAGGMICDFPPIKALAALSHNLPKVTDTFVGRGEELEEVGALLASGPVVTLAGPGGVGKSRLAVELAWQAVDAFADGVWLVELSTLDDASLVDQAIAGAIGVAEDPVRPTQELLLQALQPRQLLIVLDNCEHVLDTAAIVAGALTRACARVRILATSREPLGIDGEAVWWLAPLALPSEAADEGAISSSPSVELFLDRVHRLDRDFAVDAATLRSVAEVVRHLDGLPLAIELASAVAARIGLGEVQAGLADRLDLLEVGSPATFRRHPGLRAALDWSHDLLADDERTLYRRLSVFASPFDIDAARAVAADDRLPGVRVRALLGRLVQRSLVARRATSEGTHFRLLETVRVHARDRLEAAGEAGVIARSHATWILGLGATAAAEHVDDVRAARDYLVDHDPVHAAALLISFADHWDRTGTWSEALPALRRLESVREELGPPAAASVDEALGRALYGTDAVTAARHARRAAEAYKDLGDAEGEARSSMSAAACHTILCEFAAAEAAIERATELYRRTGNARGEAEGGQRRLAVHLLRGDYEGVCRVADELIPGLTTLSTMQPLVRALGLKAVALKHAGRLDDAVEAALDGARIAFGDWSHGDVRVWWNLAVVGEIFAAKGDAATAASMFVASLDLMDSSSVHLADTAHFSAQLALQAGLTTQAATLLGASTHLANAAGLGQSPGLAPEVQDDIVTTRELLGVERFHAAWSAGLQLGPDETAALVREVLQAIQPDVSETSWEQRLHALLADRSRAHPSATSGPASPAPRSHVGA